ncbi:1-aminocyclopropane-1-carboxylate deaminase/D-cysteine desulfhydrase [Neptunitalea lumnitzerae]|uniref:1-aminocyclopropane-1-carboxylate deaminase n=1 Tax=Neptunitalea lumnitzerae TaxID=2965509 RepID=A0ABQ5ME86_9FLAO|nr:pyridoxal-phosphate dependent enzyme [Neptunitalea sp. Y10]GLB47663.1 1-aminocyclopropane-1-carboxylate deaminase [Neptunitalea sp. Y10]
MKENATIDKVFNKGITAFVKREYLNHIYISGNKLRKLKYNVLQAKNQEYTSLLTFGGAFSNHIAATAAAGVEYGFTTIGVIRGEELESQIDNNPTLKFAVDNGMELKFVSRSSYRDKTSDSFIEALKKEYGNFYLLPEGGTNELAVKGCEEILQGDDFNFDYVCCAVGTGGTISGIINSSKLNQKVLGFPALKGDFLNEDIRKFVRQDNWELITDYHFGGYGKVSEELINFMNSFYKDTKIPLDPVYTGKMVYGIYDMIEKGYFKEHSRILIIHTGGLQGIKGMNQKLQKQNRTIINYYDI